MTRLVELGNSANWEQVYSTRQVAVTVPLIDGRRKINPIPAVEVPFVLERFILAVSVATTIPQDAEWRFAGRIYQKLQTGLVVGGGFNAVTSRSQPLFLDQVNLVLFYKISTSYVASIRVPKWFVDATINVWQYTGVDDDSLAVQVAQESANINFKLDQIQQTLNSG